MRPRKRFGQHFLEPAWVTKVVAAIAPRPADAILEIGPGRGAITLPLAASGARVLAIEVDRDLAAALEARALPGLTVVTADFLDVDLRATLSTWLGRPLEPFDIWYSGFRVKSSVSEAELDRIVSQKYPTADAFKRNIPSILTGLGFTTERSRFLASLIAVDPGTWAAVRLSRSPASTRLVMSRCQTTTLRGGRPGSGATRRSNQRSPSGPWHG